MDGTVLVADDDRTIRTVLTQALTRAGCRVHATSSLTTLMRWVAEGKGDAIITDVMMPDGNGLEMLPKIHQDRPDMPVIVISAQNNIMTAIQATEAKAFDYLPKPFDLPDLMKRTSKALDFSRSAGRTRSDTGAAQQMDDGLPLIGETAVMQSLYRVTAGLMNADLPVLISGESGTGKSLIAKVLHDFSDRRNLPFVNVKPSDLEDIDGPARVLSRAKGGTVVFEEVTDIAADIQGRIVRMIDAPMDAKPRFLGTMQGNFNDAIDQGKLRSDLYYRLGGATIEVPSLRERIDDILLLSDHFFAKLDADVGVTRTLSEEAGALFKNYSWPGNVRQLENIVKRLALTAREPQVSLVEVEAALGSQPAIKDVIQHGSGDKLSSDVERHLRRYFDLHGNMLPPPGVYSRILREIEVPLIEIALDATGGNQAKCADLLGINRNTLRKKINELDISVTRRRKLM
mgnify:CR=1 FL=1